MERIHKAHGERCQSEFGRAGRADRAARWGAMPSAGRPGGREGEERMEIKIIINEGNAGRGPRHMPGEGRHRARRGDGMERGRFGRHGYRARGGHRHEGPGRWAGHREPGGESAERGRVIGKLIELPDGRVKVVRREGLETDGPRRHWKHERREEHPRHRHEGPARWARRRDDSDEAREARRARRRLAREIVRALEESGYNKA